MQGAAGNLPTRHVAVAAFPLTSHPLVLFDLVRGIAASVPQGTVFSFFNAEASNAKLFDEASACGKIRRCDVDYGSTGGPVPEVVESFLRLAPERLRSAMRRAEEEVGCKVGCLLTEAFMWFAGDMAEEMKVPWVAFRAASASLLLVHLEIDSVRARLGTTGLEHKTLDFIPGLSSLRGDDITPEFMSDAINVPFTFSDMLYKMAKELHRASAIPVNSFHDLEPSAVEQMQAMTVRAMCIGPHLLMSPRPFVDPYGCIPWLEGQKPASVVYLSFGTEGSPSPDEMRDLAEALEETGHPYLWSCKGEVDGFKESGKSQGKIVPWAPQLEVLRNPSVGVSVTHCGWNSILESLAGGVPLIGSPYFGDQPFNAGMMERMLRIGVVVEGGVFTKNSVTKALRTVLETEEGEAMRERARSLKSDMEKAVDKDGSSARNFGELVRIICGNCDDINI